MFYLVEFTQLADPQESTDPRLNYIALAVQLPVMLTLCSSFKLPLKGYNRQEWHSTKYICGNRS